MQTTEVINANGVQTVKLPDEFRFHDHEVSIRREGQAVILEPIRSEEWPEGFFEAIQITDPAFVRPKQGETPPAPQFE